MWDGDHRFVYLQKQYAALRATLTHTSVAPGSAHACGDRAKRSTSTAAAGLALLAMSAAGVTLRSGIVSVESTLICRVHWQQMQQMSSTKTPPPPPAAAIMMIIIVLEMARRRTCAGHARQQGEPDWI